MSNVNDRKDSNPGGDARGDNQPIIVVSGLPRSGTSMMMSMLSAGGVELVVDHIRKADDDNPKGYFELEKVKQLQEDDTWVPGAGNKAVKVISMLLNHLPGTCSYRVIFMKRDMKEILASQKKMLERLGSGSKGPEIDAILAKKFGVHLLWVENWLKKQQHMEVLYIDYNLTMKNPLATAEKIHSFLGGGLDVQKMTAVVDPALYRQKSIV